MRETCSLVRDLLPLYVDGLVGEDSSKIIEEHLCNCDECRRQYEAMGAEVKIETATLPDVKKPFLRIKRFYVIRTLLVVLVLAILATPVYFGFNALRGQGITFTSFTASGYVRRAFDALQEGDYTLAAEYFDDSERSQVFLQSLEMLQQEGITIRNTSTSAWNFSLRGGYTSGQFIARMGYEGEWYDVYFLVGYRGGQITAWSIAQVSKSRPGHLPGYSIINTLHWRSEWPKWLQELDQVLRLQDNRVAHLVEYSVLRLVDNTRVGQKLNSDLWQLPMLNAVPVDQSKPVFIYFTTPASTVSKYFEESVLPDLKREAEAKGVTVVMVVWPRADSIAAYAAQMDFPVFLGNQEYIASENIKGFPTLRLYSKDHRLLWEQLGLRGNEESSLFDPIWDLLK